MDAQIRDMLSMAHLAGGAVRDDQQIFVRYKILILYMSDALFVRSCSPLGVQYKKHDFF